MSSRYKSGFAHIKEATTQANVYKEYASRIDGHAVLDYYSAENVTQVGPELVHTCLIERVHPHHTHGDATPSAAINLDKGVYNCWSWGGGDLLWLISTMEETQDRGAIVAVLQNVIGAKKDVNFLAELESYFADPDVPFAIPKYNPIVLRPWMVSHPYLYEERKIALEVLEEYQVGYDADAVRIVVPHFFAGNLVGWQKRRVDSRDYPSTPEFDVDGKEEPKYKSSGNFPRDRTLYNYDKAVKDKPLLLVESPLSVLRAQSMYLGSGLEILHNCVATFGSKVTGAQLELLKAFDKVVVFPDPDQAGRMGAASLVNRLMKFTRVYMIPTEGMEWHEDLATLEYRDLTRRLDAAQPAVIGLFTLKQGEYRAAKKVHQI